MRKLPSLILVVLVAGLFHLGPAWGQNNNNQNNNNQNNNNQNNNNQNNNNQNNNNQNRGNVPEPASFLLLGAGLAGVYIWKRKSSAS